MLREEVVVQAVEKPIQFWITPIRKRPPSAEVAQVLSIEDKLSSLTERESKVTRDNVHLLRENLLVAHEKSKGYWVRGIIEEVLYMNLDKNYVNLYLFLIDWGQRVRIEDVFKQIKFIPESIEGIDAPGLARLVIVEGLIPAPMVKKNSTLYEVQFQTYTDLWSVKALEFVEALMKDASAIFLVEKFSSKRRILIDLMIQMPETISNSPNLISEYGDFRLNLEAWTGQRLSLRDLLIDAGFAKSVDPLTYHPPKKLEPRISDINDIFSANAAAAAAVPRSIPKPTISNGHKDTSNFSIRKEVETLEAGRKESSASSRKRRIVPAGVNRGDWIEGEHRERISLQSPTSSSFDQTSTRPKYSSNPYHVGRERVDHIVHSSEVRGRPYNVAAEAEKFARKMKGSSHLATLPPSSPPPPLNQPPPPFKTSPPIHQLPPPPPIHRSPPIHQQPLRCTPPLPITGPSSIRSPPPNSSTASTMHPPPALPTPPAGRPLFSQHPSPRFAHPPEDLDSSSSSKASFFSAVSTQRSSHRLQLTSGHQNDDTSGSVSLNSANRTNNLRNALESQARGETNCSRDDDDESFISCLSGRSSQISASTQNSLRMRQDEAAAPIDSRLGDDRQSHSSSVSHRSTPPPARVMPPQPDSPSHTSSTSGRSRQPEMARQAHQLIRHDPESKLIIHREPGSRLCPPFQAHELASKFYGSRVLTNFPEIKRPNHVQAHVWSILDNEYSTVTIMDRGKTLSYVLPLVHRLTMSEKYPAIQPCAPLIIVLCSSWLKVDRVKAEFSRAGEGCRVRSDGKEFRVLDIFEKEESFDVELITGVHVLVTTPPSVDRLLNNPMVIDSFPRLTLVRCCHVVIHDSDEVFKIHSAKVNSFFQRLQAAERRRKPSLDTQVVVIAKEWSNNLKKFIDAFLTSDTKIGPQIVVAKSSEAVVYGQIKIEAVVVNSEAEKRRRLLEILLDLKVSCLVCCIDQETAEGLLKFLKANDIKDVFIIHEEQNMFLAGQELDAWRNTPRSVLILSDKVNLSTDDSLLNCPPPDLEDELLIHYDLPKTSLKTFGFRFFNFKKTIFRSYYKSSENEPAFSDRPVQSLVFLDKFENLEQAKSIYEMIKRGPGAKKAVPEALTHMLLVKEIKNKITGSALCHQLLTFGSCSKFIIDPNQAQQQHQQQRTCQARHQFLPEMDFNEKMFIAGSEIRFVVMSVISPVHFYVQIHEIIEKDNRHDLRSSYLELCQQLAELKRDDLVESTIPKTPDDQEVFLIRIRSRGTFRAILIKLERTEYQPNNPECTLLLIDEGEILVKRLHVLKGYRLPESLSESHYPRSISELVIANLHPRDKDLVWSLSSREHIMSVVMDKVIEDSDSSSENEYDDADDEDYVDLDISSGSNSATDNEKNQNNVAQENGHVSTMAEVVSPSPKILTIFRSKVLASVRRTLIVDKVQMLQRLETSRNWKPVFEIRESLLRKTWAQSNPDHFKKLIKLFMEANAPLESYSELLSRIDPSRNSTISCGSNLETKIKVKEIDDDDEPVMTTYQRAFFDPDFMSFAVFITEVISPARFFVNQERFQKQLLDLHADLKKYYLENEKQLQKRSMNYRPTLHEVTLLVEQVEDNDGEMEIDVKRVQVVEINSQSSEAMDDWIEDSVTVFFIDSGIEYCVKPQQLFPLPAQFIDRLPGQAIECSLADVEPVDDDWSNEAGDFLFYKISDGGLIKLSATDITKVSLTSYSIKLSNGCDVELLLRLNGFAKSNVHADMAEVLEIADELDEGRLEPIIIPSAKTETADNPEGSDVQEIHDTVQVMPANEASLDVGKGYEAVNDEIVNAETDVEAAVTTKAKAGNEASMAGSDVMKAVPKVAERPSYPADMPGVILLPTTPHDFRFPLEARWSQDKRSITVSYKLALDLPMEEKYFYLKVAPDWLECQYLDISSYGNDITLHRIPKLELYGVVDPQKTKLEIKDILVKITLTKARTQVWKKLHQKSTGGALRYFTECLGSSDSTESEETASEDEDEQDPIPKYNNELPYGPGDSDDEEDDDKEDDSDEDLAHQPDHELCMRSGVNHPLMVDETEWKEELD